MNSLADPRSDHNVEKKKDDDFYDNFHYVNNFPEADQIQLLTADASEVESLNQSFSPQSTPPDALIRVSISARQAGKVSADLDEDNILPEMVFRIQKKINGKEAYATALDSKGNQELDDFYTALLAFFHPIHYRVSTLTLTKISQIIFLNSLRQSSIKASNLASNSEASECKRLPVGH